MSIQAKVIAVMLTQRRRISIIGPVLFIIYINDLIEYCDCGSKLFKQIKNEFDSQVLHDDLIKMKQWMVVWLFLLNVAKCNCVSYGKKPRQSYYAISDETLHKPDTV